MTLILLGFAMGIAAGLFLWEITVGERHRDRLALYHTRLETMGANLDNMINQYRLVEEDQDDLRRMFAQSAETTDPTAMSRWN